MTSKMIKGSSFAGCIKYVIEKEKSEFIDSKGIRREDAVLAAKDFLLISQQNDKVEKPVMHISVNFHPKDQSKVTNELMREIGQQIIKDMGFSNSQYLIVRHNDQKHPHFHIVANRVALTGTVVSDKMDFLRMQKVLKQLEQQYPFLTPATHKNTADINVNRLRGRSKVLIELYKCIEQARGQAKSIDEFRSKLNKMGIPTELKFKRGSITEIQGIKFQYQGKWISGSKIDKSCSYTKLLTAIETKKKTPAQHQTSFDISKAIKKAANNGQVINETEFNDMFSTRKKGF